MQLSDTDLPGIERDHRVHLLEAYDHMDHRCMPGNEAGANGIEGDEAGQI